MTDSESSLALTPPEPVAAVPVESAGGRVRLDANELAALDANVASFVGDLTTLDVESDGFKTRVDAVGEIGNDEARRSASLSNRLLDRPMHAMREGPLPVGSTVSRGLSDLRNVVESLDPSKRGNLLEPRRLLGMIPLGSKLRAYFDEYRSSQTHLNAIVESLYRGRDELLRDNAAIEEQKAQMWALMQKLEAAIYLCKKLDGELAGKVTELETTEPERARRVKQDALFPLRQKSVDLLTQMAVNVQGYQALDLIKKNNLELIKGVDRATTTTIGALRTAVATAQALTDQKLVLDQIAAGGETTSAMIEATSKMLGEQGVEIYKQATSPTIDLDRLQRAFANVYSAMDAVDAYKLQAADSMAQTVGALSAEVDKAKQYLARSGPPASLPQ